MVKQQQELLCQWWYSNLVKELENRAKKMILELLRITFFLVLKGCI